MYRRYLKRLLLLIFLLVICSGGYFLFYANSLKNVDPKTRRYYQRLKEELVRKKYSPDMLVISAKRASWHNRLLTHFGAAQQSQHLKGTAIDIMVLDVNQDGSYDAKDVEIVTQILEKLIAENGGIGTYTSEKWIWNRQMVHFDSRGYRARWKR